MIGYVLSLLGRLGPFLLVASLCGGMLFPPLGTISCELLPFSAFLLALGSFLSAALTPSGPRVRGGLIAITFTWVGLVLPLAGAVLVMIVPLDPAVRTGVLLSLLAPPVGSAAAIASMIGLQPRLALLTSLTLTLAAPLSSPAFSTLLGLSLDFNLGALAARLLLIVGSAGLMTLAAVRWKSRLCAVLPDQTAAVGVAVIGLAIVGLAASREFHPQPGEPLAHVLNLLAVAAAINFGLCAISTLIFAGFGFRLAGTIGLLAGNRNVTLAWAAAGVSLPETAERYVAICVIPVLVLPLLIRAAIRLRPLIVDPARSLSLRCSRGGSISYPITRIDDASARRR
jgi:ACR3 family arsenite transporter